VFNAASQWVTGVRHVQVAGRLDSVSQLLDCKWKSVARLDLRDVGFCSLEEEDVTFVRIPIQLIALFSDRAWDRKLIVQLSPHFLSKTAVSQPK
jgi:hypothetical protein